MVQLPDGLSIHFDGESTADRTQDELRKRGIDAADLVSRGRFVEDVEKRMESN
jgi:hypothetical protein